jgi:hypothetical protein
LWPDIRIAITSAMPWRVMLNPRHRRRFIPIENQNLIELTSYQMVDILLRQPAAIGAIQDARLK